MTLARTTVAGLNVRAAPSSSAKLLTPLFVEVPLPKGSQVLILDGPVDADGYAWYMVGITSEVAAPVGWIAGGTSSEAWLRRDETPCPAPDAASIAALSRIQRLGCFGTRSLAFVARQVTAPEDAGFGGVCGASDGQPQWLVCDNVNYNFVQADQDADASLLLHFDPATGIEPTGLADPGTTGPLWAIRGHFGDAAAPACATGVKAGSLNARSAELDCATLFVVEAIEPAT